MKLERIEKNGKTFVMVPLEDYESMEDAANVAAFDAARARGEESFPIDLFDRIDAGENPVKVFRKYRKMTQTGLAAAAGVTHAYISQIETGEKEGSLQVFSAIAKALGIGLDLLVV